MGIHPTGIRTPCFFVVCSRKRSSFVFLSLQITENKDGFWRWRRRRQQLMIPISIRQPAGQENIYRSLLLPFSALYFLSHFQTGGVRAGVHIRSAFQRLMIYDFRDISYVSGSGRMAEKMNEIPLRSVEVCYCYKWTVLKKCPRRKVDRRGILRRHPFRRNWTRNLLLPIERLLSLW